MEVFTPSYSEMLVCASHNLATWGLFTELVRLSLSMQTVDFSAPTPGKWGGVVIIYFAGLSESHPNSKSLYIERTSENKGQFDLLNAYT